MSDPIQTPIPEINEANLLFGSIRLTSYGVNEEQHLPSLYFLSDEAKFIELRVLETDGFGIFTYPLEEIVLSAGNYWSSDTPINITSLGDNKSQVDTTLERVKQNTTSILNIVSLNQQNEHAENYYYVNDRAFKGTVFMYSEEFQKYLPANLLIRTQEYLYKKTYFIDKTVAKDILESVLQGTYDRLLILGEAPQSPKLSSVPASVIYEDKPIQTETAYYKRRLFDTDQEQYSSVLRLITSFRAHHGTQ